MRYTRFLPICASRRTSARITAVALLVCACVDSASAQWTQWGGPRRDFTSDAIGLAEKWPESGPPKIWSREIGNGHSSILVDGDFLYTMCRRGDQDAVLAVHADTGKTAWEFKYDAPTKPRMRLDFGPGPHSTPLIVGERIFTIGATVLFHCLNKRTGAVLWSHDLMEELGASHVGRGYAASPIAYRDLVILNVGGPDTGLAAFRQDTGEVVWKSEKFSPSVSSPILAKINGEDHLISALGTNRVGLDPATGKPRWKTTVNLDIPALMSTPVMVAPNRVFYTAAYGCGSRVLEITKDGDGYEATELWHNKKLRVQHANVVQIGDFVYGTSGDFGPAILVAMNVKTGKVAWRKRGFPKSTILLVDGKLLMLDEDGRLTLATASPEGLEIHAQAQVLSAEGHKTWTVPTLVGTRLYLRDFEQIMALELGVGGDS